MGTFLPFALPDIGKEEIAEVVDSLKSGWLTTGPKVKRFEQEFSEFIGSRIEAIAVNSATSGLHLALEALGIGPDDEVITTPYTFTATAEVIRYLGAHPVFADIDPLTFNIDPEKIEKAITSRTKAIIPVHFAGLACNMDRILEIARRHGLYVVEDAAHALPTTYNQQLIGSLESDVTVYSFYATKTIATGEGGMLVTRNLDIAERCRIMRLHGINRDVFDRYTSTQPSWYYEIVAPGFKYNLTDIAAAIGIQQLKKAWLFQEKRAKIADFYHSRLADCPLTLPPQAQGQDIHAWHLYVIRLDDSLKINRNQCIEKLTEKGIGCSVHFIPLHIQPYWQKTYQLHPEDFPESFATYQRSLSLPIYTKMTSDDQENVVQAIQETLMQYG